MSSSSSPLRLRCEVPADGSLALSWHSQDDQRRGLLMIIRTGGAPAHTTLQLGAELQRYRIDNLSRHQRYLVALALVGPDGLSASPWYSVTPRVGLGPQEEPEAGGLEPHLARVAWLLVMPQDRRLTAYWKLGPGFVDQVQLELRQGRRRLHCVDLEPEVSSLSLDVGREVTLRNGTAYQLRLRTRFAGQLLDGPPPVVATPAPQGEERTANTEHPRGQLVYPTLTLSPELRVFDDDVHEPDAVRPSASLICHHCQQPVTWQDYALRCSGCQAEYLPSGHGAFLEVSALRFGTCQCCLPRKILIQPASADDLRCVHSAKSHMRVEGQPGYSLIEDLRFGLCQCCRPRRPLVNKRGKVVCRKTAEQHRNEDGRYVLVPSEPVFDAAAIDNLLDAGLAEICSSGVSRGRR